MYGCKDRCLDGVTDLCTSMDAVQQQHTVCLLSWRYTCSAWLAGLSSYSGRMYILSAVPYVGSVCRYLDLVPNMVA